VSVPDLVPSGIRGLDRVLHGGFARGDAILVEGAPGTGKSTLGLEFLYRGVREFDESALLVLFDVTPEHVARTVAGFGWDLTQLERERRLKVVFTTRRVFEQELRHADSLLLEEAREIRARRIFVDGLGVAAARAVDQGRERFHAMARGLRDAGLTAMFALDIPSGLRGRLAPLAAAELVADAIILLRVHTDGRRAARSLEIAKSRGRGADLGRHAMRIVPGEGVVVYRRVRAVLGDSQGAGVGYDPAERVPTGIPGLDGLVHGGLFRASVTLLSGPTGSGKSIAGLQFLAAGAARGERGLLLSVEEPTAQVMTAAVGFGIDLGGLIDRGLVRIWSPTPVAIEPDEHLGRLEEHLAEHRPHRAVVDSLSAYSGAMDPPEVRDVVHSMIAAFKNARTTTMAIIEDRGALDPGSMALLARSSLFDNVMRLEFAGADRPAQLALTLAKLRSAPAVVRSIACEVAAGIGLRVRSPASADQPAPAAPGRQLEERW
jgi:circadian clock protein KaiC